jgi:TRAP-type mannitol/chloroaromatic compound transport system permease small subunit
VAPDSARARSGVRERIDRFTDAIGAAVSWLALGIVVLMAINVLLRYFFRTGSVWAQELEWHLLVPLILFGMSYALRHGEHVRVDILYARFSARSKHLVDLISALLAIAICALIIYLSLGYVEQAYSIGETSSDPGGLPYRFALKALIPLGFALLLVQSIAGAIGALERLRDKRP